jgi:hypothetical protein
MRNGRVRLMWLLAALAGGCSTTSAARNMVEVTPSQRLVAPTDAALVVFVRPSKFAYAIAANIIDEQGRFLGDSPAKGHFAAILPPGRHMFVVWAENTDVIDAELAPGKIYFIEVAATMGAWSAQMHLKAIKPTSANFGHRDEWMINTQQYSVAGPGGQENLNKRPDDVRERLRRAQEHLTKYSDAEREARTLRAPDGI